MPKNTSENFKWNSRESQRRYESDRLLTQSLGAYALGTVAVIGAIAANERGLLDGIKDKAQNPALTQIDEMGPHREYTVRRGDTLWTIANKAQPGETDPRSLVFEITKEQGIKPGSLQPGETVMLPIDAPQEMGPIVGASKDQLGSGAEG